MTGFLYILGIMGMMGMMGIIKAIIANTAMIVMIAIKKKSPRFSEAFEGGDYLLFRFRPITTRSSA